jgi:hypothetical protein
VELYKALGGGWLRESAPAVPAGTDTSSVLSGSRPGRAASGAQ